jgi:DNA-binding transcriptional LysR family regulator
MALPEIRLLETANLLAEELHFSRAAERLRVDQSTVSKRVEELESQLGFRLFQRNHQIVELTEAGRKFVDEARIALLHVERAIQSGRTAKEEAEAILNVGRSPYTDPFLIPSLLSVKVPLFPQLQIELSQRPSSFPVILFETFLLAPWTWRSPPSRQSRSVSRWSRWRSRPSASPCRRTISPTSVPSPLTRWQAGPG